jgi:diguanylate cyclase (GGDEF)-like protein
VDRLLKVLTDHGLAEFISYTQTLVALLDASGELLDWNPAFERSRAANPKAVALQELLSPASQTHFAQMVESGRVSKASLRLFPSVEKFEFECLLQPLPRDGFLFFAEPDVRSRNIEIVHLNESLKNTRHALEIKKIDLESVLAQADEVSHTDALTFLANRKMIVADLQRKVASSDRYRKPLTIFMADIDHFKQVNDTYGHAAGDEVLRILANRMQTGIREIDKLGRYGGDEFLFLLPDTTIKASVKMAGRVLELVRSKPIAIEAGQQIQASLSIGIAQYRIGRESWDELLKRADKALYASKNNGRDQWTIANDSDQGTISSRSNPKQKISLEESE